MAQALFWGLLSSAALFLGQLLAKPLGRSERAIGLMMGFGGGTLLAAVAYELIPDRCPGCPRRNGSPRDLELYYDI